MAAVLLEYAVFLNHLVDHALKGCFPGQAVAEQFPVLYGEGYILRCRCAACFVDHFIKILYAKSLPHLFLLILCKFPRQIFGRQATETAGTGYDFIVQVLRDKHRKRYGKRLADLRYRLFWGAVRRRAALLRSTYRILCSRTMLPMRFSMPPVR